MEYLERELDNRVLFIKLGLNYCTFKKWKR
jgi:hypothetical protein